MLAHADIHSRDEVLSIYHELNRYASYLIYLTILVFILGMLTYGQSFSFREHAISHFGRIKTQDGSSNTLSMFIFGTGMLMSSLVCFRLSRLVEDNTSNILFMIAATGYIILIAPCDKLNTVHAIGGAMVIGSLWLLTVILIHELLKYSKKKRIYFFHLVLQGTILPYAFLYATGSDLCPLVQKFAIAGLIVSLKLVINEYAKEYEGLAGPRN